MYHVEDGLVDLCHLLVSLRAFLSASDSAQGINVCQFNVGGWGVLFLWFVYTYWG